MPEWGCGGGAVKSCTCLLEAQWPEEQGVVPRYTQEDKRWEGHCWAANSLRTGAMWWLGFTGIPPGTEHRVPVGAQ